MTAGSIGVLPLINRFQRHFASHVLLYHATMRDVPSHLRRHLHNVPPDILYQQIRWLQTHFDVVELERLFETPTAQPGQIAVTFDDAYQSVFDEALPVMEQLRAPCTIFVNGMSLAGRPFWRDKVRYLINRGLVEDFLAFDRPLAHAGELTAETFYSRSKSASINSARLDASMDRFFEARGIDLQQLVHGVQDRAQLVDHPWVTYGNHTQNHYVLSSLDASQQEQEISRTHHLLAELGVKTTRVFSVPFGGVGDFDDTTLDLLKQYGYQGFLYSRESINISYGRAAQTRHGLPFRERYMVRDSFGGFQRQLLGLCKNGCLRALRAGA